MQAKAIFHTVFAEIVNEVRTGKLKGKGRAYKYQIITGHAKKRGKAPIIKPMIFKEL